MTRKECLEQAMGCVLKDRNNEYGGPEDSFGVIANFWSVYIGKKIYPADVAAMMALLKIARIKANKSYADGYVDLAGYAACGAECAGGTPSPAPQDGDELVMLWKHKPEGKFAVKSHVAEFFKAESGCCQNGNDQQEFKYGERVQFRDEIPSTSEPHWFEGVYVERLSDGGHAVKFGPHGHVIHCSDKEIRPVQTPKAEGCEDLVYDAPQTPAELYNRILSVNPATFHTPSYAEEQLEHRSRLQAHKPTGEELAEMAEEEPHG